MSERERAGVKAPRQLDASKRCQGTLATPRERERAGALVTTPSIAQLLCSAPQLLCVCAAILCVLEKLRDKLSSLQACVRLCRGAPMRLCPCASLCVPVCLCACVRVCVPLTATTRGLAVAGSDWQWLALAHSAMFCHEAPFLHACPLSP
jgi:hypothetical protein